MNRSNSITQCIVACFCITTASGLLFAQGAATMVPADTPLFIELNDLSSLYADWKTDPLAEFIKKNIPQPQQDRNWQEIKNVMRMDTDELIERYFGNSIALIGSTQRGGQPAVVAMQVTNENAMLAVERLAMQEKEKRADFTLYASADKKADVVIGRGWMFFADKKNGAILEQIVMGVVEKKPALADDDAYKTMIARLPAKRVGTAIARDPGKNEFHAVGVTRVNRNLRVHYAGKSPNFAPISKQQGSAGAMQFGPLPSSTIAAITVNIKGQRPPNPNVIDGLNRMLAPKTYETDVLPKIGAPVVLFYGQVKADRITPDPGMSLPVAGVSLQMKDVTVASDLTNVINQMMLFANMATMQWKTEPVVVKDVQYKNTSFRSANLGIALSQRAERAELAKMTISYGRIGDFFVVCTQDEFFKDCIDAHDDSTKSLIATKDFSTMALKDHKSPVVSFVLRPQELSSQINSLLAYWKRVRPAVYESAMLNPKRPEGKMIHGTHLLSGLLGHFQGVSVQSYLDDEQVLHADLNIARQKTDVSLKN